MRAEKDMMVKRFLSRINAIRKELGMPDLRGTHSVTQESTNLEMEEHWERHRRLQVASRASSEKLPYCVIMKSQYRAQTRSGHWSHPSFSNGCLPGPHDQRSLTKQRSPQTESLAGANLEGLRKMCNGSPARARG
jgi:hypothetical protein